MHSISSIEQKTQVNIAVLLLLVSSRAGAVDSIFIWTVAIKEMAVLSSTWPGRDMVVQWHPGLEDKNHPSVSWLKMVWKNLYIHFSDDLSVFDDMPLMPKTLLEENQTSVELVRF